MKNLNRVKDKRLTMRENDVRDASNEYLEDQYSVEAQG